MLRKLGHAFVIVALVAAIGGHWAVLQTVAWTTMLASNLRMATLEVAVSKTFDGQHPCSLCKVISAGKKAEKKTELPTLAKKLEFISARLAFVFSSPQDFWLQPEFAPDSESRPHAPPLPPPRPLLG